MAQVAECCTESQINPVGGLVELPPHDPGNAVATDMLKIRLDIQEISTYTIQSATQSTQEHLALGKVLLESMAKIDDRVARVEDLVRAQSERIQDREFSQVGTLYRNASKPHKRLSTGGEVRPPSPAPIQDSIGLRVRPHMTNCRPSCPCSCHISQRTTSPSVLNSILGRLFIGYSGLPVISQRCDDDECRGARSKQVSVEYWFPTSILSTIVRVQVGVALGGGPSLYMETLRRVPDASQCVSFAQTGNIAGLKYLFRNGLASPRDVSSSRGYTLLRWALYAKQYEAVEFLVHVGADPDYRPLADSDNSPRIKACHFLLEGGLSEKATNALRTITNGSDFLDDFIETWAAARGDAQAVATLLIYGADPNIMDIQISGPLSNAAAQGHTTCVELLLEAGADPDPIPPKGVKKGTPLSVASRNSTDTTLLKRLLDFGADPNTLTAEDQTPLFHATRNDNASFAILLLEHGANINALATTGETPLTTAIKCNSHNTLRLFLDRWSEYTVCPRLRGPNLLEIAALYGDCETLAILAETNHLRSKQDKNYTLSDFKSLLRQRVDVTEELIFAFDKLLSVINSAPEPVQPKDDKRRAGFLSGLRSWPANKRDSFYAERDDGETSGSDATDDDFHDAPETHEKEAAE
ncbi:ankyrin repeat-containing domain protein [Rhypophila decipiens]|uniref:Ankyrin repeat-containing domain protein n=1 Tax=Rhypophila decipiens TaxID=261697 RepID=A0AAN6XVD7_9PEZI|nr:ankyrin repeat-containing domain protein [Rhypophila decipiens]